LGEWRGIYRFGGWGIGGAGGPWGMFAGVVFAGVMRDER